jgi:phosphate transport system permease protein
VSGAIPDPTAPLTPSGNLRRRQILSKLTEYAATAAAVLAVAVLAIVVYTVVSRGAKAIDWEFLVTGYPTGVGPMLVGTAIIVAIATAMAMPIGVLIALFLTEYAGSRGVGPLRMTLDLLNGVPSIILGLFVFNLLVNHKSQTGFAGAVALAIIELPLIARGTQEVLRLVPDSMREASDALGVARWRSILTVVLPSATGGIITATVLAVARAAGETAPLLFTSSIAANVVSWDPRQPVLSIPVDIFALSESPDPADHARAWALALVLLVFILVTSLAARALLLRSRRKLEH